MSAMRSLRACGRACLAAAVPRRPQIAGAKTQLLTGAPKRPHGTWSYRTAPPMPARKDLIVASVGGGFMWWWILWHFWTEPEHVTGEFITPDPSTFTDEELGIPPDSEGLGGRTPIMYS